LLDSSLLDGLLLAFIGYSRYASAAVCPIGHYDGEISIVIYEMHVVDEMHAILVMVLDDAETVLR
jgi:hypothetical protein